MIGNVRCYDVERYFGFIVSGDESGIFFHRDSFVLRPAEIEVGMLLEFEVLKTGRGLRAQRVAVVETEQSDAA